MGGSKSKSNTVHNITTTSVADSYNQTTNRVANLSNVGNISLSLSAPKSQVEDFPLASLLPLAAVGVAVGLLLLKR